MAVAAARSNLKVVTLELGGKLPTIFFDNADLEKTGRGAAVDCSSNARKFALHSVESMARKKSATNSCLHTKSPSASGPNGPDGRWKIG